MRLKNIEKLNKMGKSWFVIYKYYEVIDKNETAWKNCKSVELRKSIYNSTRENHLEWLHAIIFSSEMHLGTNKLGVFGDDVTTMACIVYDTLTGKM